MDKIYKPADILLKLAMVIALIVLAAGPVETPADIQAMGTSHITSDVVASGSFTFYGAVDANSTSQFDGAVTVGVDGTSYDVTLYSDTAGDYLLWDESEEALTIIGTNAQDALNVTDGNVDFDDNLDVAGTTTLGGAVTVNDNATVTGTLTVGSAGAGKDVTLYSETSGDHFLWDASEEALTIIGTNAQDALNVDVGNVDIADDVDIDGTTNLDDVDIDLTTSLNIDGALTDIGSGSYVWADGDNDLGVAGVVEAKGAVYAYTTLDVTGASTFTGTITANADVVVDDVLNIDDTAYTEVGAQALSPTASFYTLNPASILTITLGTTGVAAGDILILYDAANQQVDIADTNVKTTSGTVLTLGQYDVVMFIFDGSAWIEMFLAADS